MLNKRPNINKIFLFKVDLVIKRLNEKLMITENSINGKQMMFHQLQKNKLAKARDPVAKVVNLFLFK